MNKLDNLNQQYGQNSRVISVRLNRAKSSLHGKALDYLERRESEGATITEIVAEALAAASDSGMNEVLNILRRIESQGVRSADPSAPPAEPGELPAPMKEGLLKLLKPSKRLED